jgi:2-hydroxycyclohexanecarboxyl-CoA dehydrogenase
MLLDRRLLPILEGGPGVVEALLRPAVTASASAAEKAFAKTAAREWGRYGITVNTVRPAALSPAAVEWSRQEPERFARTLSQSALRRLGDPWSDIGRAIAMLVSDDMAYFTGATVMLDGGSTILR